jgi:hypothetical protein
MTDQSVYVGIDVPKHRLNLAVHAADADWSTTNDGGGNGRSGAGAGPGGLVHGGTQRHPTQSGDQGILHTALRGGESEEGGGGGVHAQAPHDPQRDPPRSYTPWNHPTDPAATP